MQMFVPRMCMLRLLVLHDSSVLIVQVPAAILQ